MSYEIRIPVHIFGCYYYFAFTNDINNRKCKLAFPVKEFKESRADYLPGTFEELSCVLLTSSNKWINNPAYHCLRIEEPAFKCGSIRVWYAGFYRGFSVAAVSKTRKLALCRKINIPGGFISLHWPEKFKQHFLVYILPKANHEASSKTCKSSWFHIPWRIRNAESNNFSIQCYIM